MEERAKDHTQDGQGYSDQKIDYIMVSQIDGGENQATDDGQEEIEEESERVINGQNAHGF